MIELSWPPIGLFPNQNKGMHWTQKTKLIQKYRHDCFYQLKQQKILPISHGNFIPLKITFYPPNNRRFDLDNCLAASKVAIDQLAQILGVDDRQFRPIVLDFGHTVKNGKIIVEL